jgi:hypothetical protein
MDMTVPKGFVPVLTKYDTPKAEAVKSKGSAGDLVRIIDGVVVWIDDPEKATHTVIGTSDGLMWCDRLPRR